MKLAIASEKSVNCPECGVGFEITPEFYGAEVECTQCQCQFKIQPPQDKFGSARLARPVIDKEPPPTRVEERLTASGIQIEEVDEDQFAPMSTVRLTRDKAVMEQLKNDLPQSVVKDVERIPEVEVEEGSVSCPNCQASFEVVKEFYGAVGQCPDCNSEFLIKRPASDTSQSDSFRSIRVRSTEGTDKFLRATVEGGIRRPGPLDDSNRPGARRAGPAAPPPAVTTSGIEVSRDELAPKQYHATATVRLSRNMSKAEQKRQELAPPPPPERVAQLPEVHPVDDVVTCPGCSQSFEITPEFVGAVAECPECSAEFLIAPPLPAPPQRAKVSKPAPKARPAPAPPSAAPAPSPKAQTASDKRVRPTARPQTIGSTDNLQKQPQAVAAARKKPSLRRDAPVPAAEAVDADVKEAIPVAKADEKAKGKKKAKAKSKAKKISLKISKRLMRKLILWLIIAVIAASAAAAVAWYVVFGGGGA